MPAKGRGNLRRAVPPAAHCRKLPAFGVAPFLRLRCFHVVILPPAQGRQHWEIYGCHLEFARQAEAWIEERLPVFGGKSARGERRTSFAIRQDFAGGRMESDRRASLTLIRTLLLTRVRNGQILSTMAIAIANFSTTNFRRHNFYQRHPTKLLSEQKRRGRCARSS